MKKNIIITAAVCLALGAAMDHILLMGAAPATAPASTTPTYTMPNNEPGQGGMGAPSQERLKSSPRHAEMIDIKVTGQEKPLKAMIVHPQRADKAPVVICIMEVFGMSDWVKSTTDQLAADGFIAIAPDFTSLKTGTVATGQMTATQGITADMVTTECNAVRDYALKLPNCNGKSATVGFCWGGGMSFSYAAAQPDLNAAVVFYGQPPADDLLAKVKAPVAGFYGGNDARITATVTPTTATMKKLEKTYEPHVYDGAGHGFMRAQTAGANEKAAKEAWPLVIKFLKEHTEADAPK
ncbi:MAG TPA: dienelactone hydrolase family protein [Phycisphaerae bacterium]|jgi:carboxymethylenebutenolidase